MTLAVSTTDFRVVDLHTRMPFHFGNVAVREIPKVLLRIEAEIDGETQAGTAMGGLLPGWFYKDPEMELADGLVNMVETFQAAADAACALDPTSSPFAFWKTLYDRQREWAKGTDHPPLLWGYGVSLVEQAVIDAVCRYREESFGRAVRENTLGIDLGAIYDELAGLEPSDLLPAEPRRSVAIRHTVGLDDPLTSADLDPADRLDDGLPQTLSAYVRQQGVRWFKIKLAGDRKRDATRLARIADVLADLGVEEYRCTVDGNEGYDSARAFRRQWEAHAGDASLAPLFDRIAYVEQPLARDDAFTAATEDVFTTWADAPPIIIDESDDRLESARSALSYGYAGTSHKNCKGVFKGIANACLIARRKRCHPDREYVLSVEDLTTVGPIETQQDLAVAATLGADHVERNGHHYFRGLTAFPESVQEVHLEAHGDLYRRHTDGYATLDVRGGDVGIGSVVSAPFGVAPLYDTSRFMPLAAWLENATR